MPDLKPAVEAAALAGFLAGLILLLLATPWGTPSTRRWSAGWILGVGLGFLAGCYYLDPSFHFPWADQAEGKDRFLLLIMPLAMIFELFSGLWPGPKIFTWLMRLVLALGVGRLLLHGTVYLDILPGMEKAEWSTSQKWVYLGCLGLCLWVMWLSLELFTARSKSQTTPLILVLTSLAAGVTLMLSGYLNGGLLGLTLAGALAGAWFVSVFRSKPTRCEGQVGMGLIGVQGLLLLGVFFASLNWVYGLLLFLGPIVVWIPEWPRIGKAPLYIRDLARIALVTAVLSAVVWQAKKDFEVDSKTPSSPGEPSLKDYEDFGK